MELNCDVVSTRLRPSPGRSGARVALAWVLGLSVPTPPDHWMQASLAGAETSSAVGHPHGRGRLGSTPSI